MIGKVFSRVKSFNTEFTLVSVHSIIRLKGAGESVRWGREQVIIRFKLGIYSITEFIRSRDFNYFIRFVNFISHNLNMII